MINLFREYKSPLILGLLLFIVTSIPYAVASLNEDSQHEFNGYLHFSEDADTYASFINQSADGAWLFHNPYAVKINPPEYFNPLWLAAGKLKALSGLGFKSIFCLLRFIAALLVAVGFFALWKSLFKKSAPLWVMCAYLFGGGLCWAAMLYNPMMQSPDLYSELTPFVAVGLIPHAALSVGVLLIALAVYIKGLDTGRHIFLIVAGLLLLLLGFMRPYDSVIGFLWMSVAALLYLSGKSQKGRALLKSCYPLAFALPAFGYSGWLTNYSEGFAVWSKTNVYPAPALYMMFLALGLLTIPALIWLILSLVRRRKTKRSDLILISWLALSWFVMLAHFAFPWAFRTISSFWIPHFIIAVIALEELLAFAKKRSVLFSRLIATAFVLLLLPTSAYVIYWKSTEAQEQFRYYFAPPGLYEAMNWMDEHYAEPRIVYTHGHYGMKIPAHSKHYSPIAHKDLVEDLPGMLRDYQLFASSEKTKERISILEKYRVELIFWGPFDRRAQKMPPWKIPGTKEVFSNGVVSIYEVNLPL